MKAVSRCFSRFVALALVRSGFHVIRKAFPSLRCLPSFSIVSCGGRRFSSFQHDCVTFLGHRSFFSPASCFPLFDFSTTKWTEPNQRVSTRAWTSLLLFLLGIRLYRRLVGTGQRSRREDCPSCSSVIAHNSRVRLGWAGLGWAINESDNSISTGLLAGRVPAAPERKGILHALVGPVQ